MAVMDATDESLRISALTEKNKRQFASVTMTRKTKAFRVKD
jgi:hypothetical protein